MTIVEAWKAEGKIRRRASTLLTVFLARGFRVSPQERARVLDCQDPVILSQWVSRALTAESVAETLGD